MPRQLRVGVLASGSGTNLQAIIDRAADGRLDAEVVLVTSDRADARALQRARQPGEAGCSFSSCEQCRKGARDA
jgi:phosphoribosylglycinamide formyltransferase-1